MVSHRFVDISGNLIVLYDSLTDRWLISELCFPRTVLRVGHLIPAGRSGWLKL